MLSLVPPDAMVGECKYCKKKKIIRDRGSNIEWVCPVCGKKNRKKSFPAFLA